MIPLYLFVTPGVAGSVPDPADLFIARLKSEWRMIVEPIAPPPLILPGLRPFAVGQLFLERGTRGWHTLLTDLGLLDYRALHIN